MLLWLRNIEIVLTVLYFLSFAAYVKVFISPTQKALTVCRTLVIVVLILHLSFFGLLGITLGRYPVSNFFEFLSSFALALLIIYLYLEIRSQSTSMGAWVLSLAALAQIGSAFHTRHQSIKEVSAALMSPLFIFHQIFVTLALASLLISAVFSFMYLILHKSLKNKTFDIFFRRFPSLVVLGEMNYQALISGVVLLLLNTPFAFAMVKIFNAGKWDFHYCMYFTYLVVYFVGAVLGIFLKWRGKGLAIYSLVSLVVLIIATGAAKIFSQRHLWF